MLQYRYNGLECDLFRYGSSNPLVSSGTTTKAKIVVAVVRLVPVPVSGTAVPRPVVFLVPKLELGVFAYLGARLCEKCQPGNEGCPFC